MSKEEGQGELLRVPATSEVLESGSRAVGNQTARYTHRCAGRERRQLV